MGSICFLGSPPPDTEQWIWNHLDWDNPKTLVKYADGSVSSFDIRGRISGDYAHSNPPIPNLDNAVRVMLGTDVSCVGDHAFFSLDNLRYVSMPSVVHIEYAAFEGCHNLEPQLPRGELSIEGEAFNGCGFTTLDIPSTWTIAAGAFNSNDKLSSLTASTGWFFEQVFYNCGNLRDVTLIGENFHLDEETFAYCTSLTGLTI